MSEKLKEGDVILVIRDFPSHNLHIGDLLTIESCGYNPYGHYHLSFVENKKTFYFPNSCMEVSKRHKNLKLLLDEN